LSKTGFRNQFRSRNGPDHRIPVEGEYVVECHHGNLESTTHLWRGNGSPFTDDDVNVFGLGNETDGFHQKLQVSAVAREQDIGRHAPR